LFFQRLIRSHPMFGIQPSHEQTPSLPLPAYRIPPMRFLAALMRQAGLARQLEEISDIIAKLSDASFAMISVFII